MRRCSAGPRPRARGRAVDLDAGCDLAGRPAAAPARAGDPTRPASATSCAATRRTRSGRGPPTRAPPSTSGSARRRCRRSRRALLGRQVRRRPAGDLELGVPRLVAVLDAVAVREPHLAAAVDEHRAERLVAVVEGLARQLDAVAQVQRGRSRAGSLPLEPDAGSAAWASGRRGSRTPASSHRRRHRSGRVPVSTVDRRRRPLRVTTASCMDQAPPLLDVLAHHPLVRRVAALRADRAADVLHPA